MTRRFEFPNPWHKQPHAVEEEGASDADEQLSTRRVAGLLGVAESSVKRLADAGRLPSVRVAPNGKRRFRREHVAQYLREGAKASESIEAAFASEDLNDCLSWLVQSIARPVQLEESLDRLQPLLGSVAPPFAETLFSRLPFLVHDGDAGHELGVVCGRGGALALSAMLRCVLRGRGFTVISPSESIPQERLPNWIQATDPRVALFVAGGPPTVPVTLLHTALCAAHSCPTAAILLHLDMGRRLPAPLLSVASMRELGGTLDGLGPRRPPAQGWLAAE